MRGVGECIIGSAASKTVSLLLSEIKKYYMFANVKV